MTPNFKVSRRMVQRALASAAPVKPRKEFGSGKLETVRRNL
jgi:hypothetical protein